MENVKKSLEESRNIIISNLKLLLQYIKIDVEKSIIKSSIENQINVGNKIFDNLENNFDIEYSNQNIDKDWWESLDEGWKHTFYYNVYIKYIYGIYYYRGNWSVRCVDEYAYADLVEDKIRFLNTEHDDFKINCIIEELQKKDVLFLNEECSKRINDLSPLLKFTNLKEIHIDRNKHSLYPLSLLANLTRLSLLENEMPLSYISNLINLEELKLDGNYTSLNPIANFKKLKTLDLNYNESDLIPLSNLTSLETLYLQYTDLDLSPLSNLTNLTTLDLSGTSSDLTPIANLRNIKLLYLYDVESDLTPILKLINHIRQNGGVVEIDYD